MNAEIPTTDKAFRVLVLAPTGRDSQVLERTLDGNGLRAETCRSMAEACREIEAGAGAMVVAGEALDGEQGRVLEETLQRQPEWSDFPLIIMETERARGDLRFGKLASLSYGMILVRPVHAYSLLSAVRAALRSRARQYEVRDELGERRAAEAALRDASERKDEFLAMLGHELRNPLAAIRNATELIKLLELDDEHLLRAQGVLERQSAQMSRLLDGLLEVSRVARGKIHLECDTIDLRPVIEHCLQDHVAEIESRDLELIRDLPSEPVYVWADRVRLVQVLDNLVGNAMKFTPPRGSIRVGLREENGEAVITIEDTGVGIGEDMMERLFDPFQQGAQDISRRAGGLGLGLALSKGLIDLHEGTIDAASGGEGEGTEMTIRLPLAAAPGTSHSTEEAPEAPKCRVLVVEDNVDAGQSLCDLLELLGHDAVLVETGAGAVEVLRERGADLVLCDLGLPGMSGFDVAEEVRRDAALQSVPMVALTGYGQPEDRERALDAGFDDHLTKPVDLEQLQTAMRKVADGRSAGGGGAG